MLCLDAGPATKYSSARCSIASVTDRAGEPAFLKVASTMLKHVRDVPGQIFLSQTDIQIVGRACLEWRDNGEDR